MTKKIGKKGFTMIEILTVIVLLGILASMVLPRLVGQTDKAKAAEAINILGAVRQAEAAYRNGPGGGKYKALSIYDDAAWAAIGIKNPTTFSGMFPEYSVECTDGSGDTMDCNNYFLAIVGADSSQFTNGCSNICLNQSGIWSGTCGSSMPVNKNNLVCNNSCQIDGTGCAFGVDGTGPCC